MPPRKQIGRLVRCPGVEVDEDTFGALVEQALDGIPPQLGKVMRNVAVFVEDEGPAPNVLGLYQGIPLTKRSASTYAGVLPDRITIYRLPIARRSRSYAELVRQIQITVVHEVGHHFGLSDARLHELGWG